MNTELILQITLAIISIIGAIFTYVLVPYFKARTTEAQQDKIMTAVEIAVMAAEQIFSTPGMGDEKKKYVLKLLYDKGIKLTDAQLDAIIEAAVYQMNQIKAAT